jgi:DNA polymerase-3 subunit epsilon
VIYVGKALNLKKRVSSHFTGHNPNPQRQHFMLDIHSIDFEVCGTELMALLREVSEIRKIWPKYNRALKKYEPRFGLFVYEDRNNYLRLAIGKYNKSLIVQHEFMSLHEGTSLLHQLCADFGLCPELCSIGPCNPYCYDANDHTAVPDRVAIHGSPEEYNSKVRQALADFQQKAPSFYLLDKGRNDDEQSCIWVEKGVFYGMGYVSRYSDVQNPQEIRDSLTRCPANRYMMDLIMKYARRHPQKVKNIEDPIPALVSPPDLVW